MNKIIKQKVEKSTLELLAPAGSLEVFATAVDNGADAVYVGAPFMNARALAKNLSLAEISAMTEFAHNNGVKIYVAMNSLLKESETKELVKTIAALEDIGVDALIIQDLGIYYLVKKYFATLKIHASTLCTAHNSLGVNKLSEMGFDRVVLARELSINEIKKIRQNTKVDIEVFVHGAMCFSYSGLCLFSSYFGGKSGLRGRCVQPCRRRYSWHAKGKGPKSGYLFSMNDLDGLDMVFELQNAGVKSLKLEGRMRNSQYVGSVVKAYRTLIDAGPANVEALAEARSIVNEAMGRKGSSGYFKNVQNPELISHHHSGNIGLFVGRIQKGGARLGRLLLQEDIQVGDRFRLHQEKTGERQSFTLKEIIVEKKNINVAQKGMVIEIAIPSGCAVADSLYKVNTKEGRSAAGNKTITLSAENKKIQIESRKYASKAEKICREIGVGKNVAGRSSNVTLKKEKISNKFNKRNFSKKDSMKTTRMGHTEWPLPWWLKVDNIGHLNKLSGPDPDRLVIAVKAENILHAKSLISVKRRYKKVVLALPAIIEESQLAQFGSGIRNLVKAGFRDWQIAHIGQLNFFADKSIGKVTLYGDHSLNVINSLSLKKLKEFKLKGCLLSMELDRDSIAEIGDTKSGLELGVTVYGLPPLFTARPTPNFFNYDIPIISPKGEKFVLKKESNLTVALPETPFSLLSWLPDLVDMGISYVVVDLSRQRLNKGIVPALMKKIGSQNRRDGAVAFNFNGKLQ